MFKSTQLLFKLFACFVYAETMWAVHNMIIHPLMTILRVVSLFGTIEKVEQVGEWLHDVTIPNEEVQAAAAADYLVHMAKQTLDRELPSTATSVEDLVAVIQPGTPTRDAARVLLADKKGELKESLIKTGFFPSAHDTGVTPFTAGFTPARK